MISGIVLAAGVGRRMGGDVAKQYMDLCNHPILYYTLRAFEASCVDEIILVVGADDVDFVQKNIVDRYNFKKVSSIIIGGQQRWESSYRGVAAARGDYVLIHDGARCFIKPSVIDFCCERIQDADALVVGMPSKDTIKVVDESGVVLSTPDRSKLWSVSTPQCFNRALILDCFKKATEPDSHGERFVDATNITDDAQLVEFFAPDVDVYMVEGGYTNIKITTPEDLLFGESLLKGME